MSQLTGSEVLLTEHSDPRAGFAGQSLKRRVVIGSAWTFFGFLGGLILRLAGNVVMTRLLFPEVVRGLILKSRWWELSVAELTKVMPAMTQGLGNDPCRHPLLAKASKDA